jgi:hypothetical protein
MERRRDKLETGFGALDDVLLPLEELRDQTPARRRLGLRSRFDHTRILGLVEQILGLCAPLGLRHRTSPSNHERPVVTATA